MKIIVSKEDREYIEESIKSGEVLKEDLRRWFKEKWVDVSKKAIIHFNKVYDNVKLPISITLFPYTTLFR